MGKSAKTCKYPFCERREDMEHGASMCAEHSTRWLCSEAFAAACKDEGVRFLMGVSKKMGMRKVAQHRRRWAKAEAAREEEGG